MQAYRCEGSIERLRKVILKRLIKMYFFLGYESKANLFEIHVVQNRLEAMLIESITR